MCVSVLLGRIVSPTTSELYLRSGDQLHLVCEHRATDNPEDVDDKIEWQKKDVGDSDEKFSKMADDKADAPYTINQRTVDNSGNLLRSELVKNNVGKADSGYYQCTLGFLPNEERILVTVVDSTSVSYYYLPLGHSLLLKLYITKIII